LGASLGVWVVLPIVGIYPMFAAIAGMDPITALLNLDRSWVEPESETQKPQSAVYGVIKGGKTIKQQEKQHSKAA